MESQVIEPIRKELMSLIVGEGRGLTLLRERLLRPWPFTRDEVFERCVRDLFAMVDMPVKYSPQYFGFTRWEYGVCEYFYSAGLRELILVNLVSCEAIPARGERDARHLRMSDSPFCHMPPSRPLVLIGTTPPPAGWEVMEGRIYRLMDW